MLPQILIWRHIFFLSLIPGKSGQRRRKRFPVSVGFKNAEKSFGQFESVQKNIFLSSKSGNRVDPIFQSWLAFFNIFFLAFQEADLGLADLTMTQLRSQVVDFSTPIDVSHLTVLKRVSERSSAHDNETDLPYIFNDFFRTCSQLFFATFDFAGDDSRFGMENQTYKGLKLIIIL